MADFEYYNNGAIDCSVEPDLSKLKDKSVVVTGGELDREGAAFSDTY